MVARRIAALGFKARIFLHFYFIFKSANKAQNKKEANTEKEEEKKGRGI